MTEHKLRRFVLNDGAKTLAVKVIAEAKDYNPRWSDPTGVVFVNSKQVGENVIWPL